MDNVNLQPVNAVTTAPTSSKNLQQDVQPGVTTFGDVSCFQLVAEVYGSNCRRVPGTEAACVEGCSAAVLFAVVSKAPGWLEKPYTTTSPGSDGARRLSFTT